MYTLPIGTKITSPTTTYTITGVLGQGGFGITYSATFTGMIGSMKVKANAALKEHFVKADCVRESDTSRVSCSDPARNRVELTRKDFIGEARRLRKISGQNPNIITVNEVFEANNTAYYAMEMLEGMSLRDYVASRGKLTERETLSIMTPIVEAVAFLHRNRITHLDIKPQNIMIATDDEGRLRPVLIDFGLSKHYDESGDATSTINSRGFSDGYAPIEQYTGITTFSPASDVYSLAATMVFCLTGSRLPTAHEVTPKKLEVLLPPTLPSALCGILTRSLSMHAEDRYADADALLSAIDSDTLSDNRGDDATEVGDAIVIEAAPAGPKAPVKPADVKVKPMNQPKPQKKSGRGIIIAIVVIAVLLIGGAAAYFISKSSTEVAEQPTAPEANEASGSTAADAELAAYLNSAAEQLNNVSTADEFNAVLSEIEQKINAYRDAHPHFTPNAELKQALLNAQISLKKKAKELNLDVDLTPLDIPTPADTEPLQEQEEASAEQAEQPQETPKKEYADNELKRIERNYKWGYSDKNGNIIIPCQYSYAKEFSEGLAAVEKKERYGYINKSGDVVIPLIYDYVGSFREGMAYVRKAGKYGFINKSGVEVVPLIYDYVGDFNEGMARVRKDGKGGFINKSGDVVIPVIYDDVGDFSEGLTPVKKDGKYGYINKLGDVVVPLIYDDAWQFSEGLALVQNNWKYGFINKLGDVVIPLIYGYCCGSFKNGKARVYKDGEMFSIDKSGKRVD